MTPQQLKQRFGIIGSSPLLDRAINTAAQVAPTDLSVLITGESGTGKEVMPQIIHHLSARKHATYIAVNCGAIPEGTIDSELFGHEKGSFTGAHDSRKGYFEVADGGSIFLDEVAELPMQTQVRLLRVLETGEFIRVGASKMQKTNVRIVAATNVDIPDAIKKGKFREDLYYRLNTVPIKIPALRDRKEDIHLLFRKFASDFAEKYRMPQIRLSDKAVTVLENYEWPGNIRQLKNIAEQLSVIEEKREVTDDVLLKYLPDYHRSRLPMIVDKQGAQTGTDFSEREILYKVLFEMKKDLHDVKKLVLDMLQNGNSPSNIEGENALIIKKLYHDLDPEKQSGSPSSIKFQPQSNIPLYDERSHQVDTHEELVEESLSLEDKEMELIKKALEKHRGKRKYAAKELGISERTLYRKIKEYNLS
jgi:transcriptional regulator with PAS, ATPase and Fis domain